MNKKLHILFLSSWFPSRVLPANGNFVQRHAEAVATKHNVTVVHVVTDQKLQSKIEINTSIHNNVKIVIVYIQKQQTPLFKFYYFLKAYRKCFQKINNYDMVHLNITYPVGLIALFLKWFKKKPFIISEHWTDYQYPLNKTISFIQKLVTQLIIKNSKFVCPVSNHLKTSMINLGFKGNYYPIPNVVDTKIFNFKEKQSNQFTVTHISNMDDKHKNVSGLINVISKLQHKIPNLKFNLIGNNSKKYSTLIKQLKITNATIKEAIPNSKIAAYLNESSVLILFSNYENLPCVIIESFSCGVPVIASNVGGINEYFPENFGYLIKSNDEVALENSIIKTFNSQLIIDEAEMNQYAFNNFGIESISSSFSKLYYKSLNKNFI